MWQAPIVPKFVGHQIGHIGEWIQVLRKPKCIETAADNGTKRNPDGVAIKISTGEQVTQILSPRCAQIVGTEFIQQGLWIRTVKWIGRGSPDGYIRDRMSNVCLLYTSPSPRD